MLRAPSIRLLFLGTFGLAAGVLLVGGAVGTLATQRLATHIADIANQKLPSVQAIGVLDEAKTSISSGLNAMMLRRANPAVWQQAHRETLDAWARLDRAAAVYERLPHGPRGWQQWSEVKKTMAVWRSAVEPLTRTLEQREALVVAGRDPGSDEVRALDDLALQSFLAGRGAFGPAEEAMARLVAITMEGAARSRDEGTAASDQVGFVIRTAIVLGAGFLLALGVLLNRSVGRTVAVLKHEADRLRDAVTTGRLDIRGDPKAVSPEFRPLIDGTNQVMDAFERPIRITAEYVGRITRGELPPPITEQYAGDFGSIKDALNTCVRTLRTTGAELVGWDVATGQLAVGPRLTDWMGRTEGVFTAVSLDDALALVAEEDRERVIAAANAHLSGQSPVLDAEFRVRTSNGNVSWVHVRGGIAEANAEGRPTRCAGIVLDVTELHDIREQLVFAERLASVGTLASGVGHELNNPLSFVAGNLDFVRSALRDVPVNEFAESSELLAALDDAKVGALRMRDIVDALHRLGHPGPHALVSVNLKPEIEVAVMLSQSEFRNRARISVEVNTVCGAVMARRHELCQVFLNLLLNAAHAIPEGRPGDHEVCVRATTQGGFVTVVVQDDGTGIAPEVLPRIFDPFYTTKPVGKGTGLGLSITRRIVEEIGGRIEVESSLGRGSLFRILLPAAPVVSGSSFDVTRVRSELSAQEGAGPEHPDCPRPRASTLSPQSP